MSYLSHNDGPNAKRQKVSTQNNNDDSDDDNGDEAFGVAIYKDHDPNQEHIFDRMAREMGLNKVFNPLKAEEEEREKEEALKKRKEIDPSLWDESEREGVNGGKGVVDEALADDDFFMNMAKECSDVKPKVNAGWDEEDHSEVLGRDTGGDEDLPKANGSSKSSKDSVNFKPAEREELTDALDAQFGTDFDKLMSEIKNEKSAKRKAQDKTYKLSPEEEVARLTAREFKSAYDILRLSPPVDLVMLTKTYRALSLRVHPDKNPENLEKATEAFNMVSKAYQDLKDPKYDFGGFGWGFWFFWG